MNKPDSLIFAALFREAWQKCFGQKPDGPVTETESKLFCNKILDITGLSIGWKSVKNYSIFIAGDASAKEENPSVATLDTLARYVLGAPYTTEIKRKTDEGHYPYWFLYREKAGGAVVITHPAKWRHNLLMSLGIIAVATTFIFWLSIKLKKADVFTDNFAKVSASALSKNGWFLQDPDPVYWDKRAIVRGQLSLYTLNGDNWPGTAKKQGIRNLLLRPVPYDCFTAEVHLNNFVPREEWQQAGLLLLEDTTLTGKSIRLSIAFNDNFGGYKKPAEVLIQAITCLGNGFGKPEEIAHKPIFFPDSAKANPVLLKFMQNSALRIEKQGNKFRFLYAGGETENGAFKEIVSQEFEMQPKYIGVFAIKGFKDSSTVIPAHFTFFRIAGNKCQ
ncbi:hypothetical protein [Mucilaginibacter ginsenosidivorans]|uniref:Uncharacterized protein n=1 Tax=Mucilaginibacter ginsenosidivorans TaxID=398053 RepID=A0A5B8UWX0_9SPHI|nr:hypothetical protein [Mucilaginibacter ginsenosidivorans]QEC63439.1 hypothetical protein FRZ54_12915 [Mucilaginibacter ginsenosidivorans]